MMIYTKLFDLDTFPWKFKAAKVISKVVEAGKLGELTKALESRFDNEGDTASESEINDFVAENEVEVFKMCGLDASGKPIGSRRKYKVFLRITGVVSEEVEASSLEEAADLAPDEFLDTSTDTYAMIDREDVETAVPVAYEGAGGETVDLSWAKTEQGKNELKNALVGSILFTLTKNHKSESGIEDDPEVLLFTSCDAAKEYMVKSFKDTFSNMSAEENVDMFLCPDAGVCRCYITGKDHSETRWAIQVHNGVFDVKWSDK